MLLGGKAAHHVYQAPIPQVLISPVAPGPRAKTTCLNSRPQAQQLAGYLQKDVPWAPQTLHVPNQIHQFPHPKTYFSCITDVSSKWSTQVAWAQSLKAILTFSH